MPNKLFILTTILGLFFLSQRQATAICTGDQCSRPVFSAQSKTVTTQLGSKSITRYREGVICKARQVRPVRRAAAYVVAKKPVRKAVKALGRGVAEVVTLGAYKGRPNGCR